ncbi:MAG: glycosyltransferase [Candidatus Helarchaeota archaeon]
MTIHSICHVSVHGDPLGKLGMPDTGGQCVYIKEMCRALGELYEEMEIHVFTRWNVDKPREEYIRHPNVKVIRIPCGPSTFIPKEDLFPYLAEFSKNTNLYLEKNGIKCELIHGHYWDGGVVSLALSKIRGIPFIHTNHSLGLLKKEVIDSPELNYGIRIQEERRILASCSTVVTLSNSQKEALISYYDVNPSKIRVIPGGVNLKAFYPVQNKERIRVKLGINSDYLLFALGRCDPRKGFDQLLHALPFVIQELKTRGKTLTFILATGTQGVAHDTAEWQELDRIMMLIENLNLQEHVIVIGHVRDPPLRDFYSAADLLVVPSIYEPFGLVILEAMACGCPVIATNNGGPKDILRSGAGTTVDVKDHENFAKEILNVLENRTLWKKMSRVGIEETRSHYDWSNVARQLYRDVYLKSVTNSSK